MIRWRIGTVVSGENVAPFAQSFLVASPAATTFARVQRRLLGLLFAALAAGLALIAVYSALEGGAAWVIALAAAALAAWLGDLARRALIRRRR
jgi:uncharacterized membrane protein YccC